MFNISEPNSLEKNVSSIPKGTHILVNDHWVQYGKQMLCLLLFSKNLLGFLNLLLGALTAAL